MAQAGRIVICGDAGDALGDSLYEAVIYVRGKVSSLGADAHDRADDRSRLCGGAPIADARGSPPRPEGRSSAWRRRAACTTGMPTPTRNIDGQPIRLRTAQARREPRATTARIIDYIQHAAAHGLYEIRGLGAKRQLPHFDDLLFLAASLSRYPLEGYREHCETKTVLGTRFANKADRARDSHHHRRDELRRAVGQREGGAGPWPRPRWALRRPPAMAA